MDQPERNRRHHCISGKELIGENNMSTSQILLVEDERLVAMSIQKELEHFGYKVSGVASTAKEAVEKASETKPDLVLMDIHLKGGVDGVDAAQQIYSQLGTPVVFI
jgi:CheY-like chemotaxis protein